MNYYAKERPVTDVFREKYEFLSSFVPSPPPFDEIARNNAEGAYQAQNVPVRRTVVGFHNYTAGWGKPSLFGQIGGEVKLDVMAPFTGQRDQRFWSNALRGFWTGEAKLTGDYQLKAKHIIHTVGPVYGKEAPAPLTVCYQNCMDLAMKTGVHSIAFPAVSTGTFRYPKSKATAAAVGTLPAWRKAHSDYPTEIAVLARTGKTTMT